MSKQAKHWIRHLTQPKLPISRIVAMVVSRILMHYFLSALKALFSLFWRSPRSLFYFSMRLQSFMPGRKRIPERHLSFDRG